MDDNITIERAKGTPAFRRGEDFNVCGTGTQESIHVIDDRRVVQATLTRQGTLQLAMVMQ